MEKDIINIKGTRYGLVICLDSNHDFEELKKNLQSKIESARGFFRGAKFVFHIGSKQLCPERTKELQDICSEQGLIHDGNIPWPGANIPEPIPAQSPDRVHDNPATGCVRPLMRAASPSLPMIGVSENDKKPCLLISRSLRSGQKINYDGNVVILGDINPGSEITASGDIVILGSLRGVVHAGANGSEDAVIVAYRLNPVQLRIASTISRPPENNSVSSHPEVARLQHGRMFIEPYLTFGLKQQAQLK